MNSRNRRQCSGQILVLGVLVISILLLSTQLYIYEVGKSLEEVRSNCISDLTLAMKLGSKHTLIGSLANISVGGESSTLLLNLERWAEFSGRMYQLGRPVLEFVPASSPPYTNGSHLSWTIDGLGISSAYVDFNLSVLDLQVDVQLAYAINVTTTLVEKAFYLDQGSIKKVDVTCSVMNEGRPALAENITVLFQNSSSWVRADEQDIYGITDYGNGTYLISFEARIEQEDVRVSAQVHDLRGIYVQANVTCTALP